MAFRHLAMLRRAAALRAEREVLALSDGLSREEYYQKLREAAQMEMTDEERAAILAKLRDPRFTARRKRLFAAVSGEPPRFQTWEQLGAYLSLRGPA